MGSPNGYQADDAVVNIPLQQMGSGKETGDPIGPEPRKSLKRANSFDSDTVGGIHGRHRSVHQRGRRRRLRKGQTGGSTEEDSGALTAVGRFYEAVLNFSLITRYFLYILPVGALISVPIFVGAFAKKDAALGGVRIVWIFVWVEVVWVSFWVAKLFCKCLPAVFQAVIGVVSSKITKYALILRALETPLSLVCWALASWISFIPIMTGNPDQRRLNDRGTKAWESRLTRVMAALLVGSIILFVERLLIQIISVSYHRKQYSSRIKGNKRAIVLLTELFECSRAIFPLYCPEFAEEDYIMTAGFMNGIVTPGMKTGSSTPMKMLGNIGRVGDKFTSVVGRVAQEVTGRQGILDPESSTSIVNESLDRRVASEALAKRIWMSFVSEGKEVLDYEDLLEVMSGSIDQNVSADVRERADECMNMLDKDSNGDVGLDEMILKVVDLGRERKSVAKSMHDVDSAISVLNNLLSVVVFFAAILVLVAFMNQNFGTMLAAAGTALLSLSFVFAGTAQEFLGSCIFLFVKHPYDVGDRVDIDSKRYVVDHISLLFTVFRRVENNKLTQVPNSVLNSSWVENISRSAAMQEMIKLPVHFDTTIDDITILREELLAFVKANSRDFLPDIDIEISDIPGLDKIELMFLVKHKTNWANEPLRTARRNKFMAALVLALKKVPIYAPGAGDPGLGTFGQPSYSVAISDEEAQARVEKAKQDKEGKRFRKPDPDSDQGRAAEELKSASRPPGAGGKSTGVDLSYGQNVERRRDPRDDQGESEQKDDVAELERRSTEIEEVRGILSRESTRGRRKRGQVTSPTTIPERQGDIYPVPGRASTYSPGAAGHSSGMPTRRPAPGSGL